MKRILLALSALASGFSVMAAKAPAASAQEAGNWRFGGDARVRYETLDNAFRAGRSGSDQLLSWRIRLRGEADAGPLTFGGEFLDARGWLNDEGSFLSPSLVNTAELFQAYIKLPLGVRGELQLGRFTMTIGSGRLVNESGFTNSPNNFEGARARYALTDRWMLETFFTVPVERRPSDRRALLNNTAQIDKGDYDRRLWGVHATRAELPGNVQAEAYLVGLNEDGGAGIFTPGLRLMRSPAQGVFDFDIEAMYQFGEVETVAGDFDVRAGAIYAEAGYTFAAPWRPRLSARLIYASGDRDPADARLNRFNRLFGLRRGEFGHTSIFGPLDRENIVAPAIRLELQKGPVRFDMRAQEVYLASSTDRLRQAGLRDVTGGSGRHVGQHLDARVRWRPGQGAVELEAGMAALFKGRFAEEAPNAPDEGDSLFSYVMISRSF